VQVTGLHPPVGPTRVEHVFDTRFQALTAPLTAWAAQDLGSLPPAPLPGDVEMLLRLRHQVDGELTRRLAAADRSGHGARLGAGSTAAWLRDAGRLTHREASTLLATARGLSDRLPATAAALSEGDISLTHAGVLSRAVTPERAELADQHYTGGMAQAETDLLQVAIPSAPDTLARAAHSWAHTLDPQQALADERTRHAARALYVTRTLGGHIDIAGTGEVEGAETILTAIEAAARPTSTSDTRTPAQRRYDALVEICHQHLNTGTGPEVAGERPHLTVTMTLDALQARAGAPAAGLGHLGPVTGHAARRLACDAAISRVITTGPSQILDVGRRTRTIHPALRRALVARDGGCTHPGCDRPPSWCEAHHLHHWADGGPTTLANLTLLCRRHHRHTHTTTHTRTSTATATSSGQPAGQPPPPAPPPPPAAPAAPAATAAPAAPPPPPAAPAAPARWSKPLTPEDDVFGELDADGNRRPHNPHPTRKPLTEEEEQALDECFGIVRTRATSAASEPAAGGTA